jgi:ATP-dependent DNA helicase PIF1
MALNKGQQEAYNMILSGQSVFLTGPGGTGKSFLIKKIVDDCASLGKKVAVTALTGCAALLLGSEAKTIHSWAGIGLGREPAKKIVADIRKFPYKRKVLMRWLLTHVLIIDEVSMMTPELFELLNEVGQLLRRTIKPFGGIQVVLVGDFFQLPPVVKEEQKKEQMFVFESPLWKEMNLSICQLKEIVRQKDADFHKILEDARVGSLSDESLQVLLARQKVEWQGLKIRPTLLFSRRAEVEMINESNLKALSGKSYTYNAETLFGPTLEKGLSHQSEQVKFAVAKLDRDAPYKTMLELKQGAQVMLIYNMDQEAGLVNGSRGVVEGFTATTPPFPLVLFKGQSSAIPIAPYGWKSDEVEGVIRSQIPLIMAYANTIHKMQGATLDCALIDIGPSTFEVGQAYVALSRVKDLESLYIYDLDPRAFKAHPKVLDFYKGIEG